MNRMLAAAAALGVAVGLSTAARADVVYSINQTSSTPETAGEFAVLSDTVVGTITTDGKIGALETADILGWNLELKDNIRPSLDFTLTPANSGIWFDTGDGLSATATALSFDFSKAGAVFIIQGTSPHGFSSGFNYFCFQATTGPCLQGETIVPDYYATDGVLATGLTGTVPLKGAVPEPGAWALMLTGFGGLGAVARARRRAAVA